MSKSASEFGVGVVVHVVGQSQFSLSPHTPLPTTAFKTVLKMPTRSLVV